MKAKCTNQELYQQGNVVYNAYWNNHDLVLDVQFDEHGFLDYVECAECKPDGEIIGRVRRHCTSAWRNDHVVTTVSLTELGV